VTGSNGTDMAREMGDEFDTLDHGDTVSATVGAVLAEKGTLEEGEVDRLLLPIAEWCPENLKGMLGTPPCGRTTTNSSSTAP